MDRILPEVRSRYGKEHGFVSLTEAKTWAKRQSELLQGRFNVYDGEELIASFENGK